MHVRNTEAQAREKGYDVKTSSFPFCANGKARGMAEGVGFVKIVADSAHHENLGAHLIGPEVTELTLARPVGPHRGRGGTQHLRPPDTQRVDEEAIEGINL